MGRPRISESTVKRLFARSQNCCAFPGCTMKMVGDDGVIYGEICHIEGVNQGSARFNPNRLREALNDEDNLVLMCPTHHTMIDSNTSEYTVERLHEIKRRHEVQGFIEILPTDVRRAKLMIEKMEAPVHGTRIYDHSTHFEVRDGGTQNITIKNIKVCGKKKLSASVPTTGNVGSDAKKRSYVKHLHDRLFDFMAQMPKYSAGRVATTIARGINKQFGATWSNVPIERYDELVRYLKAKIDQTIVGKRNLSRGVKSYSTLEEFLGLEET